MRSTLEAIPTVKGFWYSRGEWGDPWLPGTWPDHWHGWPFTDLPDDLPNYEIPDWPDDGPMI